MTTALRTISSMATRRWLAELAHHWHASGRAPVAVESVGGVDAARRVRDGEAFDAVVLAADAIDALDEADRLLPGSRVTLARSPVAVAVREHAVPPDIGDAQALQAAVAAAPRIGYSTGPSGAALMQLFERWGLAETLKPRLVQAAPGVPVASLIARGDVTLGFQQLGELMHMPGVAIVGTLPRGVEIVTPFCGAICRNAAQPDAARDWLAFLQAPTAHETLRRHGMQPA